jgi:capsular polysaccharide biosynthesis protein
MQVRREPGPDKEFIRPSISKEPAEGEHVLTLRDLLYVVQRYLWALLLVPFVVVGMGVGYTLLQTPTYEASIKILVGQKQGSSVPGSLGNDVQGIQQLTGTMAELVKGRPVAEEVIRRQELPMSAGEIEGRLDARAISETQLIQVSYTDSSPQRAQEIVNTLGEVFSEQVPEVIPGADAVIATVWEQAELPTQQKSPNLSFNVALALLVAVMLDLGLVVLFLALDRKRQKAF